MGVHIASRDWEEAHGSRTDAPSGTTRVEGLHLNEPMRGFEAFRTTFRAMFLEEWRETVDFARARQVILFPLLLALITMVTTCLLYTSPSPRD